MCFYAADDRGRAVLDMSKQVGRDRAAEIEDFLKSVDDWVHHVLYPVNTCYVENIHGQRLMFQGFVLFSNIL